MPRKRGEGTCISPTTLPGSAMATSDGSTEQDEVEEHNGWRGHQHFADWPEELAGPEYWLYKRMAE